MLIKKRLMTPGPTHVAEATRLALAAAQPHHRSAEFSGVLQRVLAGLAWLWDTDDDVLVVTGSGTAGMEAAMRTCIAPGQRVAVVTGGKFAERWDEIARVIGADVEPFDVAWGRSASPEELASWLQGRPPFDAFVAVCSETSTGALHPVAELITTVREHSPDVLSLVDGITAVGCVDLSMKRDGIDVLVSGSQKAFGLPPGAAFVGVGARAWQRADEVDAASYYFDLRRERAQRTSGKSAFTPAASLVLGLEPVLEDWQALGRDGLFAQAAAFGRACRAGVTALGYEPFAKDAASPALTSFSVPDAIGAPALRTRLRTQYGLSIAGGQNQLAASVLRIGHLGAVDAFDVLSTLAALELATAELGGPERFGAATGAATAVLAPMLRGEAPRLYAP